jgi:hypothetical protein
MRLGTVVADVLSDLKFTQFLNDPGADEKRDQQRRERGKGCSKREEAKEPEWMKEEVKLFVQQPVKQAASRAGIAERGDTPPQIPCSRREFGNGTRNRAGYGAVIAVPLNEARFTSILQGGDEVCRGRNCE